MSQHLSIRRLTSMNIFGRLGALAAAFLITIALFTGFVTAKTTYLISDSDRIYTVEGYSGDVSEAFIRAGITLQPDDTFEITKDGGTTYIDVIRTVVTKQTTYEAIPHDTIRRANPKLAVGTEQVVQEGADGTRTIETETRTTTGREPVQTFVGTSVTEPVTEIIEYGTGVKRVAQSSLSATNDVLVAVDREKGILTTASGETHSYSKVITCTATAYTTEGQSWKRTATGTTARLGAIAVDPKVIPYGTKMYIVSADGSITYGIATAEDCGGGIKGKRIDLFFNTHNACLTFGRRTCTVYILA